MNSGRRYLTAVFAVWAMAAASGCATSLQPLVTSEARTDVPEISGKWVVETTRDASLKGDAKVRIERRGVGSHYVEIDQAGVKSAWHADTVKLGETVFVDLFPEVEADSEKPEGLLIIATHVFFLLERTDEGLKLYGFDHGKLDSLALEERVAVSSPRNHRIVFVAEPKRLQDFFAKHGQAQMQKLPFFTFKKDPRG